MAISNTFANYFKTFEFERCKTDDTTSVKAAKTATNAALGVARVAVAILTLSGSEWAIAAHAKSINAILADHNKPLQEKISCVFQALIGKKTSVSSTQLEQNDFKREGKGISSVTQGLIDKETSASLAEAELVQNYFGKLGTDEKEDIFQLFFSLNNKLINKEKMEEILNKINEQQTQLISSVEKFINSSGEIGKFEKSDLKPFDSQLKEEIQTAYPDITNSEMGAIRGLFIPLKGIHSHLVELKKSIANNDPATIIDSYAGLRLQIEYIQEYIQLYKKSQVENHAGFTALAKYMNDYSFLIKELATASQAFNIRNKIEEIKLTSSEVKDMYEQLIRNMSESIIATKKNPELSLEDKDKLIQLIEKERKQVEESFPLVHLKNQSDESYKLYEDNKSNNKSHISQTHSRDLQDYIQKSLEFLTTVIDRLDSAKRS